MLARLRARLTFANVCSFLALLIALGTGSAYAANTVFSTDIVDGEVKAADLDNNSVRSAKIGTGQVLNQDLGADAVDGSKLADGAVDSAKVVNESLNSDDLGTNSVGATEVADATIDSGEIVNDSLFDTDLATGSVRNSEILDGTVATTDIANSAVTGAKVANNSITSSDIAGGATNGSISVSGVPNGRCAQISMSVGGAALGEVPAMATNGAIQNGVFIFPMRVETAGHVEASVCNFSGTSMTAIVDLPVRILTFG